MKILPFRGYRYNTQKISSLDDVISPPYDQFKNDWDERFHGRHPYNISHIIMNPGSPEDTRMFWAKSLRRNLVSSGITTSAHEISGHMSLPIPIRRLFNELEPSKKSTIRGSRQRV